MPHLCLRTSDREALMGLGQAASRKGSLRDAVLAFKKLLALDPRDIQAHRYLGEAFLGNGLTAEAVKEFLTAGTLLVETGDFSEARSVYERILEVEPGNATATREISNANAILAEQQVRTDPGTLATSVTVDPVPTEEDLYASVSAREHDGAAPRDSTRHRMGAPEADTLPGRRMSSQRPLNPSRAAGSAPPCGRLPANSKARALRVGAARVDGEDSRRGDSPPDRDRGPLVSCRIWTGSSGRQDDPATRRPDRWGIRPQRRVPFGDLLSVSPVASQAISSGTSRRRRRRRERWERWEDADPELSERVDPAPDPAAAPGRRRLARRQRGESETATSQDPPGE